MSATSQTSCWSGSRPVVSVSRNATLLGMSTALSCHWRPSAPFGGVHEVEAREPRTLTVLVAVPYEQAHVRRVILDVLRGDFEGRLNQQTRGRLPAPAPGHLGKLGVGMV